MSGKRQRARRGSGELLRTEIIAATRDLLAETGSADAVSIRAVAAHVGVTPPSIYLHFADKNALLDAVVSDVFADLDREIVAAAEAVAGQSPLAVLRAQGLAYVRFALAHREHYRVATMDPCVVPPDVDEVLREGAFAHFMTTVQSCMDAGIFPPGDPLPVALDLWAAAHGAASMMIAKPYLPWGEPEVYADRVLRAAAIGHAALALIGPDAAVEDVAGWLAMLRPHPRSDQEIPPESGRNGGEGG